MAASDPQLKRWFNKFNSEYFGSELPENTLVWWEPCHGYLGHCSPLDDDDWMIRLDPTLRFSHRLWKPTLLHEMAHLSLRPYTQHGKRFLAEIDRLYSLGAFRKLL